MELYNILKAYCIHLWNSSLCYMIESQDKLHHLKHEYCFIVIWYCVSQETLQLHKAMCKPDAVLVKTVKTDTAIKNDLNCEE